MNAVNIFLISIISFLFSCNHSFKEEKNTKQIIEYNFTDNDILKDSLPSNKKKVIDSIPKYKYTSLEEAQKISINELEIIPYTRDTILSDGYHLSYRVEKDTSNGGFLQSMTLVKGTQDIKMINMTSYPMHHKSLGYIGVDFGKTFVFMQSYGSGNPNVFQLIEKETGNEIKSGIWLDANKEEQILLYIQNEELEKRATLLDLKNGKEQLITEFKNSNCVNNNYGGIRNCLFIKKVTDDKILLEIESDSITKEYLR